jgi:transposase-like protein
MTKTRRKITAEQKAAIVRRHVKDKLPISSIAEELSIQPTQIHQWVALAFEQVERAFEKSAGLEPELPLEIVARCGSSKKIGSSVLIQLKP